MRTTLALFLSLVTLSAFAGQQHDYQQGTLVDINHHDSSRVVGNPANGSVTSVDDREYEITVKVGEITYVGSYWMRWNWSYEPTDFTVNSDIKVRLTKTDMYIVRPNGKVLRTKIIKRIAEKQPLRK